MSSDYIKARLVARSIEDAERTRLQNEADAKLGRMVRKLHPMSYLSVGLFNDWEVVSLTGIHRKFTGDIPEAALEAAGIKDE